MFFVLFVSKTVTHDEEVSKLYEEMECQIKLERERILAEVSCFTFTLCN